MAESPLFVVSLRKLVMAVSSDYSERILKKPVWCLGQHINWFEQLRPPLLRSNDAKGATLRCEREQLFQNGTIRLVDWQDMKPCE